MKMRSLKAVMVLLWLLIGCTTAWAGAPKDATTKGKAVYAKHHCGACHTINKQDGKVGGDLGDVGGKRTVSWLKRFLQQPRAVMPEAKMPPFNGSEQDLELLVAYLASLK